MVSPAYTHSNSSNNVIYELQISQRTPIGIFSIQPITSLAFTEDSSEQSLSSQRNPLAIFSVQIDLSVPSLITGIRFIMNDQDKAEKMFSLIGIQGCAIKKQSPRDIDESKYVPVVLKNRPKTEITPCQVKNQIKIEAYSITKYLRIQFYMHEHPTIDSSVRTDLQHAIGIFRDLYSCIEISGICIESGVTNAGSGSIQSIDLLNISSYFAKEKRFEEQVEVDLLYGYTLVTQRKYIQAGEIFGRSCSYFLSKKNIATQHNSNDLLKAAKAQLLVAECIRQPNLIDAKVQAYQNAAELFQQSQGASSSTSHSTNINNSNNNSKADAYTNLLGLAPYLCKFLLRMIEDRIFPVRNSAIKALTFLVESLGCTVSSQLPSILKSVILSYPTTQTSAGEGSSDSESKSPKFNKNNQKQQKLPDVDQNDDFDDFDEFDIDDDQREGANQKQRSRTTPQIKEEKLQSSPIRKGGSHFLRNNNSNQSREIFENYHNLLEAYLNLLASCSSSILRSIFNDVASTQIFNTDVAQEVKIYLCRIINKIIGICQGDLNVNQQFILNMFQYLIDGEQQRYFSQLFRQNLQKLWENLKEKLLRTLELSQANDIINLIFENLHRILQSQFSLHQRELQFWIELTYVVMQRERRTQENLPSSFAKYARLLEASQENLNVKILINPFIEILEMSSQLPSNIESFKLIWNILVEILTSVNGKSQREVSLYQVIQSTTEKVKERMRHSSLFPLQQQALISIFSAIPQESLQEQNIQNEVKEMLKMQLEQIPHSTSEESFALFEILVSCLNEIDEAIMEKIILSFSDQFTMKSKVQKKSLTFFIQKVLKQPNQQLKELNYFSIVLQVCLLSNKEPNQQIFENQQDIIEGEHLIALLGKKTSTTFLAEPVTNISVSQTNQQNKDLIIQNKKGSKDSKLAQSEQDIFYEKLDFLSNCFESITPSQIGAIIESNKEGAFSDALTRLISSTISQVRLKGFQLVRILYDMFMIMSESDHSLIESIVAKKPHKQGGIIENQENRFSLSKILVSKIIVSCLRASLERLKDPKQQFNSLVLMDKFFSQLFKGPDLENELSFSANFSKEQNVSKIGNTLFDLETSEFSNENFIEYSSDSYLQMRLSLILKLWPLLQNLVNSPWSNIRSLTHGVICNWARVDVSHYSSSNSKKFLAILFRILVSLLQSKESECRTGGLNIIGSLCGLSYNFDEKSRNKGYDMNRYLEFFRRYENIVPLSIWEAVYEIQSDWDVTNQAASMILIQICAPRAPIRHFYRLKQENNSLRKITSSESAFSPMNNQPSEGQDSASDQEFDDNKFFWLDSSSEKEIRDMISMFRGEQKPPVALWIERDDYNTEQKQQGTGNTEVITYTMNEEEDAGVYGYFEDLDIAPTAPQQIQQQPSSKSPKTSTNQQSGVHPILQQALSLGPAPQQVNNVQRQPSVIGVEEFIEERIDNTKAIQQSNLNHNLDQNVDDYDCLGIIDMEEEEDQFTQFYEETYQNYKNGKNNSYLIQNIPSNKSSPLPEQQFQLANQETQNQQNPENENQLHSINLNNNEKNKSPSLSATQEIGQSFIQNSNKAFEDMIQSQTHQKKQQLGFDKQIQQQRVMPIIPPIKLPVQQFDLNNNNNNNLLSQQQPVLPQPNSQLKPIENDRYSNNKKSVIPSKQIQIVNIVQQGTGFNTRVNIKDAFSSNSNEIEMNNLYQFEQAESPSLSFSDTENQNSDDHKPINQLEEDPFNGFEYEISEQPLADRNSQDQEHYFGLHASEYIENDSDYSESNSNKLVTFGSLQKQSKISQNFSVSPTSPPTIPQPVDQQLKIQQDLTEQQMIISQSLANQQQQLQIQQRYLQNYHANAFTQENQNGLNIIQDKSRKIVIQETSTPIYQQTNAQQKQQISNQNKNKIHNFNEMQQQQFHKYNQQLNQYNFPISNQQVNSLLDQQLIISNQSNAPQPINRGEGEISQIQAQKQNRPLSRSKSPQLYEGQVLTSNMMGRRKSITADNELLRHLLRPTKKSQNLNDRKQRSFSPSPTKGKSNADSVDFIFPNRLLEKTNKNSVSPYKQKSIYNGNEQNVIGRSPSSRGSSSSSNKAGRLAKRESKSQPASRNAQRQSTSVTPPNPSSSSKQNRSFSPTKQNFINQNTTTFSIPEQKDKFNEDNFKDLNSPSKISSTDRLERNRALIAGASISSNGTRVRKSPDSFKNTGTPMNNFLRFTQTSTAIAAVDASQDRFQQSDFLSRLFEPSKVKGKQSSSSSYNARAKSVDYSGGFSISSKQLKKKGKNGEEKKKIAQEQNSKNSLDSSLFFLPAHEREIFLQKNFQQQQQQQLLQQNSFEEELYYDAGGSSQCFSARSSNRRGSDGNYGQNRTIDLSNTNVPVTKDINFMSLTAQQGPKQYIVGNQGSNLPEESPITQDLLEVLLKLRKQSQSQLLQLQKNQQSNTFQNQKKRSLSNGKGMSQQPKLKENSMNPGKPKIKSAVINKNYILESGNLIGNQNYSRFASSSPSVNPASNSAAAASLEIKNSKKRKKSPQNNRSSSKENSSSHSNVMRNSFLFIGGDNISQQSSHHFLSVEDHNNSRNSRSRATPTSTTPVQLSNQHTPHASISGTQLNNSHNNSFSSSNKPPLVKKPQQQQGKELLAVQNISEFDGVSPVPSRKNSLTNPISEQQQKQKQKQMSNLNQPYFR